MFPVVNPATQSVPNASSTMEREGDKYRHSDDTATNLTPTQNLGSTGRARVREIEQSQCFLKSVNGLRADVETARHNCELRYHDFSIDN